MAAVKVYAPEADYSGSLGSLSFQDGVAEADSQAHAAELAYAQRAGYRIDPPLDVEPAVEEPVVERDVDGDGVDEVLPKKSASAAEWRAFAAAHGMSEDEASEFTRDELVAHFTKEDGQ